MFKSERANRVFGVIFLIIGILASLIGILASLSGQFFPLLIGLIVLLNGYRCLGNKALTMKVVWVIFIILGALLLIAGIGAMITGQGNPKAVASAGMLFLWALAVKFIK